MNTLDSGSIPQQIFRPYREDGSIEFLMGLGLMFATFILLHWGNVTYLAMAPVLLFGVARAWRNRITYPRLGYAVTVETHRVARRWAIAALALTVLAVAVTLTVSRWPGEGVVAEPLRRFLLGGIIAMIIAGTGMAFNSRLLFAGAVLTLLLAALGAWLGFPMGYALALPSLLLIVGGLFRLRIFLRQNPKLEGEA